MSKAEISLGIGIVGMGRMGAEIERIARERGHDVMLRVDPSMRGGADASLPEALGRLDVVLEFTEPAAAAGNVRELLGRGVSVVSGTTGWDPEVGSARELANESGAGFLWAPNFSLGVNILFRLVDRAARWLGQAGGFSPYLVESHHDGKKDGPSGTARRLAASLVEGTPGKSGFGPAPADAAIAPDQVPVAWVRAGAIPGEHRVGWDAPGETIEIVHRARQRSVFAFGAVRAAEWLAGRQGAFTIEEMLDDLLDQNTGR